MLKLPTPRHRAGPIRRLLRRPGGRRVPPVSVLPTLMTLGNLVCGFAAIHYATKPLSVSGFFEWSTLTLAGALIFLGMAFDALDGSVARLTRTTSDLGAQLDSLADVVTFGVAPAFMMLRLVSEYVGPTATAVNPILGPEADSFYARIVWGVAAVYICCAALRLARFNVETESHSAEDHRTFRGLPSPGAGGAVASAIILHQNLAGTRYVGAEFPAFDRWTALGMPLLTLLCGLAMVSTIRYAHIVNRYLRGSRDFAALVRIVLPIAAAIWFFHITLAVAFVAYALSGPVRAMVLILQRRTRTPIEKRPT